MEQLQGILKIKWASKRGCFSKPCYKCGVMFKPYKRSCKLCDKCHTKALKKK